MAAIPVAAVSAAAWAALCGLAAFGVVVTVGWVLSPRADDGLGVPLESAGLVWLVSHHAGVTVGPATVTLLPLALMLVPLSLLRAAGAWAARITAVQGRLDQALLVLAGTTAYSLIAFGVSQVCDLGGAATVSVGMTVGWSGVVAVIGLSMGILSAKGGWPMVWSSLPEFVRAALAGAVATGAALIALSAVVGVVAVLARWSQVVGLGQALGSGWTDAIGVCLLSLVYLPNLLMWVLAYISGPGLIIGGGATASVFSVTGGLLPSIPVLAAVPSEPGRGAPLLLLLVAAAGVPGAVIVQRHWSFELRDQVGALIVSTTIVSIVVLVFMWLSGGALGAARLGYLGPRPLLTALSVWALTTAGALVVALISALRRPRVLDAGGDPTL